MFFWEERIEEILRQIKILMYSKCEPIPDWRIDEEPQNIGGELYSPEVIWYKTFVDVPVVKENQSVEFHLETGVNGEWEEENPQFEFYVNGKICQAIDRNHRNVLLDEWQGQNVEITLRGYLTPLKMQEEFRPYLQILEKDVEQYYYDVYAPYQVLVLLEKDDTTYQILLDCVNGSLQKLDMRKPFSEAFFQSMKDADAYILEELYEKRCGTYTEAVFCVGHTHIDIAWLWPLGITRRKAVRSFSTVISLMKRYPEYIFMSSQPQLYAFVKEEDPELYEQIKARVAEGRWETEGGMFVEADCNLSGGEALVRQFLKGKEFFRKEFGKENEILWLPDVFGYSAALPQIMKECGIHYFMTTKISWNDTNKLPYDTFYWKGIDGTRILTHFITTRDYASASRKRITNNQHTTMFSTNYNGDIVPCQIKGGWQRYQQKDLNRQVLNSFGYGDGGGGTTKEMLEMQRRLEKAIPGCPKTKIATAREFFHTMEGEFQQKVPVWSGELYLEYHRATYTSMGKNKKYNRFCEFLLQNLEMLNVYSGHECKETLDRAWEILLRNQFHDILPGSSIEQVYKDSEVEYERLISMVEEEAQKSIAKLEECYQFPKGSVTVFNFNGVEGKGNVVVKKDEWKQVSSDLQGMLHQECENGEVLIKVSSIPAKGFKNLTKMQGDMPAVSGMQQFSTSCVENAYYKLMFNEKGQFASFYDKRIGREILQDGVCGNVLMTYEDKPFQFDNWNLEHYYTMKSWEVNELLEMKIVEEGPIRYGMQLIYKYLDSKIVETLYFYPDHSRIDMNFNVDWKEDQIFLKLLFGLELNTNEASYEIQYGNVVRNTTKNTSWDCARFEVCYHKWMDLSEAGYGVSFLNDCKYGVSVEDNVVGLSLIKSGTYPNPNADRGEHEFSIAMYPHMGSWREADTVGEAYRFNNPLLAKVCQSGSEKVQGKVINTLIQVNKNNVIVEAMKKAEDGDGYILRMYECYNSYENIQCIFASEIVTVEICNMMEETKEILDMDGHMVNMVMKPYEIKTIRVRMK